MPAPTPSSPPQPPPPGELEVGALEVALQRGCRRLRFEPALEAAYEHDTGAARTLRHLACNVLGTGAFWLLTQNDPVDVADPSGLIAALRCWATIASLIGVAGVLLFRRSVRSWQRETVTGLGTLLITSYTTIVAHHVSATPLVMHLSGMVLILLHASIGARLQFRFAIAVNLLTCLGYATFAHGASAEAEQVLSNQLLLFGTALLLGSTGNYLLEFRERRGYLLQCLNVQRHDSLLADAAILRQLALHDGLTNLYNRRHFDAELGRAWQAGLHERRAVSVLQIDVDHFKAYNDRHGHPAGDQVLAQVAAALQGAAERAGGLAARIGGEEFALLLPDVGATGLDAVAADACRSVRALALPHAGSRCASHVTVSVGFAAAQPAPGLASSALVAAADAALYTANAKGATAGCAARCSPNGRRRAACGRSTTR